MVVPNLGEWIFQPMYDTATIPATAGAAGTGYRMFQNPVGAAGQTYLTTNMTTGSSLPKGYILKCSAIAVRYQRQGLITPATDANDFEYFRNHCILEFNILTKNMLRLPLGYFTSGNGLAGWSGAAASNLFTNGTPDPRAVFTVLPYVIELKGLETFDVTVTQQTVLPFAVAVAFGLQVALLGELLRPVQ